MELPSKIETVLKVDADGFLQCSGKDYTLLLRQHHLKDAQKTLDILLDGLGANSAKAQALKQVITNSIRFLGTDHRIYIKVKDNKALGFLKVGEKNLFYRDFVSLL